MLNSWLKNPAAKRPTISQAQNWLNKHWPLGQAQPALISWLLSFILQQPASHLIAYPDQLLTDGQWRQLNQALAKLTKGYPLAYITGQQDFYSRQFIVSPAVLIPRPESECLVDTALELRSKLTEPSAWLDIGTGSGCLVITLAKELNNADYYGGSDISLAALRIAQENADRHNAKIVWRRGSLLQPWLSTNFEPAKQIFLLANLPYLKPENYRERYSELRHEPKLALVGGHDGLDLFKKLAQELPLFIQNHPDQAIHLLTESGLRQVSLLQNQLAVGGLKWQQSFHDLTGRQRFGWWHN